MEESFIFPRTQNPEPITFSLHPKLEADTIYAGDLTLSRVMLMNNANFPWLILVPRVTSPHPVGEVDSSIKLESGEGNQVSDVQNTLPLTPTLSHRERGVVTELFELSPSDQQQFLKEVSFVSETIKKIFSADKMNIAMLGNQVPQLHCHVIARFKGDKAWPNPVWGAEGIKYTDAQKEEVLASLKLLFSGFSVG